MRLSREAELLEFLSQRREGFTWRELVGKHVWAKSEVFTGEIQRGQTVWPKKTLDRLLKTLIKKGYVEKVLEPRGNGERGRQRARYRIPKEFWHSWGVLAIPWPAKKVGPRFFLGQKRKRAYSGKEYTRLFSREAKEYREYLKSLRRSSI